MIIKTGDHQVCADLMASCDALKPLDLFGRQWFVEKYTYDKQDETIANFIAYLRVLTPVPVS